MEACEFIIKELVYKVWFILKRRGNFDDNIRWCVALQRHFSIEFGFWFGIKINQRKWRKEISALCTCRTCQRIQMSVTSSCGRFGLCSKTREGRAYCRNIQMCIIIAVFSTEGQHLQIGIVAEQFPLQQSLGAPQWKKAMARVAPSTQQCVSDEIISCAGSCTKGYPTNWMNTGCKLDLEIGCHPKPLPNAKSSIMKRIFISLPLVGRETVT